MLTARCDRKQMVLLGSTLAEWFAYGISIFLILFPKGGFKSGSVPLTWGYSLVGVALIVGVPIWLLANSYRLRPGTLGVLLCLAPLQSLFCYSLLVNGVADFGFALSDIVNFFVLPFTFLAVFPHFLKKIRMDRLFFLVSWLVLLAAAYGIFSFGWRLATGKYIEIPYLTVNIADIGTLEDKYNSRPDGLFKLISTYNNGNQYGVATLLLLPLCNTVQSSRFHKIIIRVALLLTLSRTVWIGLILNEGLDALRKVGSDTDYLRRLSIRNDTFKRFTRLALLVCLVLGMSYLFSGVSFIFDSSLGGRTGYFDALPPLTLLPTQPVGSFAEIIYLSALTMLGFAGLAAISILFCFPLLLAFTFKGLRRNSIQVAALQGLVLYIPLAAMDGALNYIPTIAFYWFLWMLLIHQEEYPQGREEVGNIVPENEPTAPALSSFGSHLPGRHPESNRLVPGTPKLSL